MCPLISAPNRGYADYQRVGNYDSGILWSVSTGLTNLGISSPLLDVSRYAYLGGTMAGLLNQTQVSIFWYVDAAGTIQVGQRAIQLYQRVIQPAQIRLPNLGPFVQINCNIAGGANQDFEANIFGTNRVHPLEFIPVNPVVIDQQAAAIPANSTVTLYPSDYYAGPAAVYMNPQFGTGVLRLEYLTGAGTWDFLFQYIIASGGILSFTWILPPGAWRVPVVSTNAAASTFYLTVTPSTTGAT